MITTPVRLLYVTFLVGISLTVNTVVIAQKKTVVIQFIIDGLPKEAAETAIKAGATNLAYLASNGVVVEEAYSNSPVGAVVLPDGTKPWGGASPPNIAMQTGTHIFETQNLDDIFLAARRHDIPSVFAGGHSLYSVFQNADTNYADTSYTDEQVVDLGIKHIRENNARLIRLHLQRIRKSWTGPACKSDVNSDYIQAILAADAALGKLIDFLKQEGLWKNTFIIVTADHGMGQDVKSSHPPKDLSSWQIYMNFYGPGIKRGATIPYAESPDLAIMTNHFLDIYPLQGYTSALECTDKLSTTGVFLENLFNGKPDDINHPHWIKKYLDSKDGSPSNSYLEYRQAMLDFMNKQ